MAKITEKKMYDLIYFIAILTIAALMLNYLLTLRPEMTMEKRLVGGYTTAVLRLMGVNAVMYENVVRINKFEEQANAVFTLNRYMDEMTWHGEQAELRSLKLHPDDAEIVESFIDEQRREGHPIYYSTATVIAFNHGITEVDVIPECVGWMGLFAVTALIFTKKINRSVHYMAFNVHSKHN